MAFLPSLMALGVASVAACLSINSEEEVVKVAMASAAILSLLLTLILAPWILKLAAIGIPLGLDRLNAWSE